MTAKEKLVRVLSTVIYPKIGVRYEEVVADYLLDHDVVPVVRCKYCTRKIEIGYSPVVEKTEGMVHCPIFCCDVPENHYCSFGAKMDEVSE